MRYSLPLATIFLLFLSTSCQVYRAHFDCPPGMGLPCASVSEIEGLIIEAQDGPDLFLGSLNSSRVAWRNQLPEQPSHCMRRVWIPTTVRQDGHHVSAHYVFLRIPEDD